MINLLKELYTKIMNDLLTSLYYDASGSAGFSSSRKLYNEANKIKKVTKKEVDSWLRNQTTYSLHFPARRRFIRNPILARSVGDVCQADLVDMRSFSSINDGFGYILTFIDVFSKKAFAVPIKRKTTYEIIRAFRKIFESFIPFQINTDRGTEFKNTEVISFMKENRINIYFTQNQDTKAACVERFNRTLKQKMFRYFTFSGSRRYIDVLPALVESYNKSLHQSIKMTPNEAIRVGNQTEVFRNLYGFRSEREYLLSEPIEKPKFQIGQKVRLRYEITGFEKGYYPNYTDVIFKIKRIIKRYPRLMYQLETYDNKIFPRKVYSDDLLAVSQDPEYRIEKILRKRKRGGQIEVFVKFVNYPDSANQWIPESSIKHV